MGLIDWVEQGRAPTRLIATRREGARPVLTRLLCPFPSRAFYDGQGDSARAASFVCRDDAALIAMLR